jgi:hypothetical protein
VLVEEGSFQYHHRQVPTMSRIFFILLAGFYSIAAFFGCWMTFALLQLQQNIRIPALASAVFIVLTVYAWSEVIALCRSGHSRFPIVATSLFSLVVFSGCLVIILPYRRVRAAVSTLQAIHIEPDAPGPPQMP